MIDWLYSFFDTKPIPEEGNMDWQTMIIISFIGVVVMAIVMPKMLKRYNVSAAEVVREQSKEGWQVKFAQGWYECQPFNSSDPQISSSMFKMGLGMVKLTDRRTHSRMILRPLSQIRNLV